MSQNSQNHNIIALDIGDNNIGVARAGTIARLPEPLDPIINDTQLIHNLNQLLNSLDCKLVVVGVPRNLSGQETAQSKKIRELANHIQKELGFAEFVFVDESLSSVRAIEYLKTSNKKYSEDSVAACYILDEYFTINNAS